MPDPDFKTLHDAFRDRCDKALRNVMTARKARAVKTQTDSVELVETLERLVKSGGKRLRPSLVWFGHTACHGKHDDSAMLLATACEFLHTYLLVHDDIMDHADTRRGQTTAHIEYRDVHKERRWHGDSAVYGESVGILVGDLAWAWASELASRAVAPLDPERADFLAVQFFGMTEEVIFGQHQEMRVAARRAGTAEDLARVLRLKSGCYSVQRPLQLGAYLAGADDDLIHTLGVYGSALGEAFQLVDDLLGLFGDPSEIGKPVGGDFVEGKFTFIIHHALANATSAQRTTILERLGDAGLAPETVTATCSLIEELGGRAAVEEMIAARMTTARNALATATPELAADGVTFLEGLIGYLGDRQS